MYELNRARLISIGPRGARFTDVTLDLADVGPTIPAQHLLQTPVRRPSPSSLLILENGGGKSVLLKLLFSVVLPGRRKVVGKRGTTLDNFVLDSDTGHVALEWMHVRTGDRLVTAKVYQRRTPTVHNPSPLAEAWYSFRPSRTVDLASLPVITDGRRRRLEGYREALHEAHRNDPAVDFAWLGDDQTAWRHHLRNLHIEPDLFDIQRNMNADEGDAAEAFTFRSSREFADWLLKAVTDPQDAASVAENFATWATQLAERDSLLQEQDFLEGTLAGLGPVAEAFTKHTTAQQEQTTAQRTAGELAAALTSRITADEQAGQSLQAELQAAQQHVTNRTTERDKATETVNEILRQTAHLALEEARNTRTAHTADLATAKLELDGWALVDTVHRRDEAAQQAATLGELVAEADREAAPLLRKRDSAAGRLLAALHHAATHAEHTAHGHETAAAACKEEAEHADRHRLEAHREQLLAEERHRVGTRTLATAQAAIDQAIDSGLLPPGTPPTHIAALADQRHSQATRLAQEITETRRELTTLEAALRSREKEIEQARKDLTAAQHRTHSAQQDEQTALTRAQRLAHLPAIQAAAGQAATSTEPATDDTTPMPPEALDAAADALLSQLATDASTHETHLAELRTAQQQDQRIWDALGDDGLLPPRPEVATALAVLHKAGVAAQPGWRYLHATARRTDHTDLINSHPQLADGIVLIDDQQLPKAQAALEQARLYPAAAVAVGTGATLLQLPPAPEAAEPTAAGFVIEPSPALHDEDAAHERRAALQTAMDARSTSIQQTQEQLAELSQAATQLAVWRGDYPPGRLAELAGTRLRCEEDERTTDSALGEHTAAQQHDKDTHQELSGQLDALGADERVTADQARTLKQLADTAEQIVNITAELPDLAAEAQQWKNTADDLADQRAHALDEADDHTRRAVQAHADADRHRARQDDIRSTTGAPAPDLPDEPLPQLQAAYHAAQRAYETAAADDALRQQSEQAAQQADELRARIRRLDPTHLAEAERLLAGPTGTDPAAWAAATRTARERHTALENQRGALDERVGQLDAKLDSHTPTEPGRTSWTTLPEEWRPTTIADGRTYERQARQHQRQAQQCLEDAIRQQQALTGQSEQLQQSLRDYHDALLPLKAILKPAAPAAGAEAADAPTAPFPGTPIRAAEQSRAAVQRLHTTDETVHHTRTTLDQATQEVTAFARLSRFEGMTNSVRRSILDTPADAMAARAAQWLPLLTARLQSITAQLETASRYRKNIVDRLAALTHQALGTLRTATRLSTLPTGLGDWTGLEFLRIRFTEPDQPTLTLRVGDAIDRLAATHTAATSKNPKRDGLALLLECVHAAVPAGITVDVLKPDSVLRDERLPIEQMHEVFSGGQELTAAIILYCTLAALRANERGQMRARHSGVLFLDNPIGKASASYLLDLQQGVAGALGVQLIYTTGLSDDRALAAFPLWIRLRNDADLRAGLKHLRVADEVRTTLPTPFTDDPSSDPHSNDDHPSRRHPGTVTATRIYRRPPTGHPATEQP